MKPTVRLRSKRSVRNYRGSVLNGSGSQSLVHSEPVGGSRYVLSTPTCPLFTTDKKERQSMEPIISYGFKGGSKTLTATSDGNFVFERCASKSGNFNTKIIFEPSDLIAAIESYIKEQS